MLGGWANLVNIALLQYDTLACCAEVSLGSCLENTLGIVQVFAIWLLFTIIFVLYLAYFPTVPPPRTITGGGGGGIGTRAVLAERLEQEWKEAVVVTWLSLAFHLSTLILSVVMMKEASDVWVIFWAGIMGIFGTLTGVIQYVPQLISTWHSKSVGALSIFTMMIQAPGSFLLFLSLAVRPGTNWTTWLPYFVTGSFQSALLAMCLVWRARAENAGYVQVPSLEERPESGAIYWEEGLGIDSDVEAGGGERRRISSALSFSAPAAPDSSTTIDNEE